MSNTTVGRRAIASAFTLAMLLTSGMLQAQTCESPNMMMEDSGNRGAATLNEIYLRNAYFKELNNLFSNIDYKKQNEKDDKKKEISKKLKEKYGDDLLGSDFKPLYDNLKKNIENVENIETFVTELWADSNGMLSFFRRNNFSICRSTTTAGSMEAAAFSFRNTFDDGATAGVFATDFAVSYRPAVKGTGKKWDAVLTAEGHFASAESDSRDSLEFRLTGLRDIGVDDAARKTRLAASFEYETDNNFDSDRLLLNIGINRIGDNSASGRNFWDQIFNRDLAIDDGILGAVFDLRANIVAGYNIEPLVGGGEQSDTIFRIVPQASLTIPLKFLEGPSRTRRAELVLEHTLNYLPLEADGVNSFFQARLTFAVVRGFNVGLSYRLGQDAPSFLPVEAIRLEAGVRF